MKIRQYTQHHITLSLARSGALLMLLLLFSIGYLLPGEVNAAAITCSSGVSGCHFAPTTSPMVKDGTGRNIPGGRFTGTHARHSGYSTSSAKRQYQFACTVCHGLAGGYGNAHQTGFKNVSSSSLPGNRYSAGKKIANTNSPAFGNCGNIYCHSSGRATGMGQAQYSSVKWGGTETCLGCHGGRNGANPARSVGNFTLSTTHSQHLKYPEGNVNCQICHSKTATNATTLKSYTGVQHHINGVRDVTFTAIAYGSYTSYKSTEAGSSGNTKNCSNTSCHGGKTRGVWSNTVQNTDHQCAHCHGTAGTNASTVVTGANRYNLRFFAPGYKKTGTVGTSTDQIVNSNDFRVGSHFKHLSSAYMKNIKCNECHKVPSTPFSADTNHTLNTLRFNSGTLDFGQSSSARILIGVGSAATPAQLSAFAGYTNGTAIKAATCSSVYCHGNRLKNGAAGGTYLKPYWNYSAMINYTDKTNACARCHGNPPTSVSASHSGKTATTSCSGCHSSVVDATGKIINKDLHINGRVEAAGGHAFPYPGATHGVATGATDPAANCSSCHDYTTAGTYPVAGGTAPKCKACHTVGLLRTVATTSCYDCHGATATDGRPNGGTAFPNWSGSHTTHVVGQSMPCSNCHNNGGTGNTAHGFSNGVAKTRTTVNVQQGGGVTFTYTAASQTCSTVSCHGNAVWSVTQFDCLTCHTTATGGVRAITPELGSGSSYKSHHVTGIATSKWHCIICHAEGNTSTGGTTGVHKNGTVELRNVDSTGNPGAVNTDYWSMPATMTPADYANLNTFCFRCHDAGGATKAAMTSATAFSTAPTGAQATNPFADTRANSYDQVARSVVLDVETQFTTTNPSHHAVRGRKYTSTGTQYLFAAGKFNTFNTKEGTQVKDGSLLHCHDCHAVNGHGTSGNEYMLQSTGDATGATLHGLATYVCLKCHLSTYNGTTHTAGNGGDFQNSAGLTGSARLAAKMPSMTGISCAACHGGMNGWGGIHGMSGTYTDVNSATQTKYRFMPGMANSGYDPAGWTATGQTTGCYTPANASWAGCVSHSSGIKTTTGPRPARPLSY